MNKSIVATIIAVDMMLALPTTSHAETRVSVGIGDTFKTGGILEVGLHIELIGPGATDALATKWATWIEEFWQEMAEENSCMNLNVTADVTAGNKKLLPVLADSSVSIVDMIILNLLEGSSEGNDAWYVVDTNPGQTYRAWVQAGSINQPGSYGGDVVGMLHDNAMEGTVIHEAGHLLGMDDHYTDDGGPDPGWDGNVMAETWQAGKVMRAFTGIVPTDGRNFQEMMNAMEELAGVDVRPCMLLEALIDTSFNNPPTNIDRLTGEMKFEIRAAIPLVRESGPSLEPPTPRITGDGEGEHTWTVEARSDETLFGGFVVDNNPWPIEVSGFIEDETIYQTNIVALDEGHSFLKDGSSYGDGPGVIQSLMSNNATVCTADNLMLALMRLDIDLVEVGMTCEFPINVGYFDNGKFTVTVVSVQGNGAPVK